MRDAGRSGGARGATRPLRLDIGEFLPGFLVEDADQVDRGAGALEHPRHARIRPDVAANDLDLTYPAQWLEKQRGIGMANDDADAKAGFGKALDDIAAKES